MPSIAERRFDNTLSRLSSTLARVEQSVQTLKWRFAHLPDDLSVFGQDVESLAEEICVVSRLFGELSALGNLCQHGGHECDFCGIGLLAECGVCFRLVCEGCSSSA